ncbi:MAG: hypothetical protein ACRD1G_11535, partial [Acidimicrobiales bacterium]
MTQVGAPARDVAATAATTGVSTPRRGPGYLDTLMAPSLAVTAAGTQRRLLVLASEGSECAAIDIETGAMVRAHAPVGHHPRLATYDVLSVVFAAHGDIPDPAQPEAVSLEVPATRVGRLKSRQIKRHLQHLTTPPGQPLFGFPGPATPYWTLTGANPSIALIRPESELQAFIRRGEHLVRVKFAWG